MIIALIKTNPVTNFWRFDAFRLARETLILGIIVFALKKNISQSIVTGYFPCTENLTYMRSLGNVRFKHVPQWSPEHLLLQYDYKRIIYSL